MEVTTRPKPSELSFRDRSLIERHKQNSGSYEVDGKFQNWEELSGVKAVDLIDNLIDARVLPVPRDEEDKIIIVSTSANCGSNEKELKRRLSDQYIVVAGDVAGVKKVRGSGAVPFRFDASFLPFANGSIDVILDTRGALWYEAHFDIIRQLFLGPNTLDLMSRYREKLSDRGMVITDLHTAAVANQALMGIPFQGFEEPIIIGRKNPILCVYAKSA